MTPVKPNVERLVGQLIRLRASLPAALAKRAKAEERTQFLSKALQNKGTAQLSMITAQAYRNELGGWQGALDDPARLERDIAAIEADLREVAKLIAQVVTTS
jgi:hypothetical protein